MVYVYSKSSHITKSLKLWLKVMLYLRIMISYIRRILFAENGKNNFKRLPGTVNNKGIKWVPYTFSEITLLIHHRGTLRNIDGKMERLSPHSNQRMVNKEYDNFMPGTTRKYQHTEDLGWRICLIFKTFDTCLIRAIWFTNVFINILSCIFDKTIKENNSNKLAPMRVCIAQFMVTKTPKWCITSLWLQRYVWNSR